MNVTKETVTPKKAMEWLKRNVHNRPLRCKVSERIASAIGRGEWTLNGETIKFNGNGDLIDGQHRLNAVVISGKPIESYVIRGVPHEAFDTIDTGTPRGNRDVFARLGKPYYSHLATAIRAIRGIDSAIETGKSGGRGHMAGVVLTNSEALALLNEGIEASVSRIACSHVNKLMSIGLASALHYVMSRSDSKKADAFWDAVSEGEGLTKSMPTYWFRERMIANRTSASKLRKSDICAIAIKAWNAFKSGRQIKTLKYSESESFPAIE